MKSGGESLRLSWGFAAFRAVDSPRCTVSTRERGDTAAMQGESLGDFRDAVFMEDMTVESSMMAKHYRLKNIPNPQQARKLMEELGPNWKAQLHRAQMQARATVRFDQAQRAIQKAGKFVIDPRFSNFMAVWDIISASALLYTSFITPFEVAFGYPFGQDYDYIREENLYGYRFDGGSVPEKLDVPFVVNRILDAIFGCDLILQFFLACVSLDP